MITRLYFDEGDIVKKNDLLAELDTSEVSAKLRKAEADLKQAEVNLASAESNYRRKEALYREQLLTKQQYDDALTKLDLARAAFKSARAIRDTFKLQYDYSFIKTPVSGIVAEKLVDVGDTVTTGQRIASVVDADRLYISAPVDEADVSRIALGQNVKITMDAYPEKVFSGKVIRISPIVTGTRQETRTFEVRVSVPEEDIVIKPGMSADVEIVTGMVKDTLVIPFHAVIERESGKFVYVNENGKAKLRKIEVGLNNWNYIEIKKGLTEGEMVIFAPDIPDFKEGKRVRVVNPS
jgi:RND family efflux transporter MFP subunit